jgi:hypothetical protein
MRHGSIDGKGQNNTVNFAPSTANGQLVTHQQLGSGFVPNLILSHWAPGAPVNNTAAEITVAEFTIGGAGFQAATKWELEAGWLLLQNFGSNTIGNFRVYLGSTVIASNENNASNFVSTVNQKSSLCWLRLSAITSTQVRLSLILRSGLGQTIDNIDSGNYWDHTGLNQITVADLNTPQTLRLTVQSEVASPNITITPVYADLTEKRPNGSIPSGGTPGGADRQVQYNNSGAFAGAANVDIVNGNLASRIVAPAAVTPAPGFLVHSGVPDTANMPIARYTSEFGDPMTVSPFLSYGEDVSLWVPPAGSQPMTTIGSNGNNTGTTTAATTSATNAYTRSNKVEYLVTTASTTAVAGYRDGGAYFTVGGTAAGIGGFKLIMHGAPATGVATATSRFFMGVMNSIGVPTDIDPSTIPNLIGIGYDSADANLQLMHRGGGAATKINLGATFPVPTTDRSVFYRLLLNSPSGTTQVVYYRVINLVTGAEASGTITTNLPITTTFLTRKIQSSAGGTSSVIGIGVGFSQLNKPMG